MCFNQPFIIQMSHTDVNECGNNNGGCTHKCVNTAGGHQCECPNGLIGCYGGEHIYCHDIVTYYCHSILKIYVGVSCMVSTPIIMILCSQNASHVQVIMVDVTTSALIGHLAQCARVTAAMHYKVIRNLVVVSSVYWYPVLDS